MYWGIHLCYFWPVKFNDFGFVNLLIFRFLCFGRWIPFHQFHKVVLEVFLLMNYLARLSKRVLIEKILPGNSSKLIFREHFPQKFNQYVWNIFFINWNTDLVFRWILIHKLLDVRSAKRSISEKHLEQDNTTRPYIGFWSINLMIEDLRGHVERWAKGSLSEIIGKFKFLTEAKVSQFNALVLEENIVRLDISVDDVIFIEGFITVHELSK